MARLFTSGAENGNAAADGVTLEGGAVYTAVAISAMWSWLATETTSTTQRVRATFVGALDATYFCQVRLRFDSNAVNWGKASGADIFALRYFSGGVQTAQLRIDAAGKPMLFANNVQIGSTGPTALLANQTYLIELGSAIFTAPNIDYAELRIDGVSIASASNLAISAFPPGDIALGALQDFPNATVNITLDDLVLNDNTGGAPNNTWPGGVVVAGINPADDPPMGILGRGAGW